MATINLNNTVVNVLEVEFGESTYKIPLGSSLPYKKLKSLDTSEKMFAFFEEYLPNEMTENMTIEQWSKLLQAWSDATKAEGTSLGH